MPSEHRYKPGRKRSKKIGTAMPELGDDFDKKSTSIENPIFTWLKKDWQVIVGLIIIFFISLFLRAYFYYPVATEDGFLLSGNDPFYHKRVIDYAQQYFIHLKFDPLLDYPLIGKNPRPPVYDWSNAISGLFLSPALNGDIETTTWYIFLFSPAIWGALTIFPVYFLTRDMFGRKAAIFAAFFMGIMASHIERSPLGFADHDAMVVFFVVTSILFLAKAFGHLKQRYWVNDWKNPVDITNGLREFFYENKVSLAFSIMSGFSIATVALIWKGFPYVLVILLGSFLILSIINHLRKFDNMGIFFCIYIAFFVGLALSLPWYAAFNIGTWIQPLYMMMAFIIIGIAFIPTRDLPWIIVIPSFLIIMAVAMTILSQFQPETVDALFTGGGYFVKSKLYSTIAEAQAPDTSRLAISYGPVTFYLTLIGLVLAAIQIPKHWNIDFFLIIVWCALAIYMAMSAVRFMFNATPVFAILSGWITYKIFEYLDPTLRVFKKMETRFVYLYIIILTFIIMTVAYWWVYLEHENFIFYQIVIGFGLFGIFVSIFTAWVMLKYNLYVGILIYVSYILLWIWYTLDALINQTFKGAEIIWDKFPWELFAFGLAILALIFVPMIIFIFYRHSISGSRIDLKHVAIALFFVFMVFTPNIIFAIDASIPYEDKGIYDPEGQTFGSFGHSFPSDYWQAGMDWLANQDTEFIAEERPAFISWWDYGFWCLYLGEHPTVADNFQAGYQLAGSFIAATNETQAVSLFAVRILEGDYLTKPKNEFSPGVRKLIINYTDKNNEEEHPNYDKIVYLFSIETQSSSEQKKLIKEVENNPKKYGKLVDIKLRNAKYAAVRHILESMGEEQIVEFLKNLEDKTGNCIRYFAVDTRLYPFSARNTGIFYAPIKLADKDIGDYIEYFAKVEIRKRKADGTYKWESYSDKPIPTEKIKDEIDLYDLVDTHGGSNVRIKDYVIKYTDDFYNSMFYRCYIGYTYKDVWDIEPTTLDVQQGTYGAEVPGLYGSLANSQVSPPMQGWNMTHFRLVYRTAYWTPHNESTLRKLKDEDKGWEAMSELEAINNIRTRLTDGKDNNDNGEIDEEGEGGIWSAAYTGGGVYFLKYYHGAFVSGKVVTDSLDPMPLQGIRVTVQDEYGIPHDTVFTDENGNYNLTVPFGHVVITASKDGYPTGDQEEMKARVALTEQTKLNQTVLEITDQQAMRITNYNINEDIKIPVGSVNGRIYWDKDDSDSYGKESDKIITDALIFLDAKNLKYNLSYNTKEIEDNGKFKFDGVVPGKYKLTTFLNGHFIETPDEIEITTDEMDVEKDMIIKQAIVKGNATYINDTTYLAKNVKVQLKDLLNNTIINHTLYENNSYEFTELLSGEYIISVDEPGIKYFSQNFTLDKGEKKTLNIDFIPLVPVSGKVYKDPDQMGYEPGNVVGSAHVEFINLDNSSLSSVFITNNKGYFSGNITNGNYTIYIHYTIKNEELVHISSITVTNITHKDFKLSLETGFWINGKVTKQAKTPEPNVFVKFTFTGEPGQITLPIPTNSEGFYRAFIPYKKYEIEIDHLSTPGELRYVYYDSLSYLKSDVEKLILRTQQSSSKSSSTTKSRQLPDIMKVTKNIHLIEATLLWGYVYWDHNRDGKYIIGSNDTQDAGTRSNGDIDLGYNTDTSDTNLGPSGLTYFPDDLAGPENELVIGTKLVFQHETTTLYAYTDENGYYKIYLPPGNATISMGDLRFKPLKGTNNIENLSIFALFNRTNQPKGTQRDFSVVPYNTTISGITWNDINSNSEIDENYMITEVPISFSLLGPQYKNMTNITSNITSDSDSGRYAIQLMPGEYLVEIEYNQNKVVKYSYSGLLKVPFNSPTIPFNANFGLFQHIYTNFSFKTEDFELNQSDLKNISIDLIMKNGKSLDPLILELNEPYYKGYIAPLELTIKVVYPDNLDDNSKNNKYVYIGFINVSEENHTFEIILRKATKFKLSAFVDADFSGNFTFIDNIPEFRPGKFNVTLMESSGAVFDLKYENGSLNRLLMPGTSYRILVNDTESRPAAHGIRIIRYIADYEFEIPINETVFNLDLPLTSYYNLSGKVYYDENENSKADNFELYPDVTLHFTGPMNFTILSNASGRFNKYALEGEYFVTLEHPRFLNRPKKYSFNLSLDETFFDIEMKPRKVRVHGFTFFDVDGDDIFVPGTTYKDQVEKKLKGVKISFARTVFFEEQAPEELPGREPLEERAIKAKSSGTSGEYEVYLPPGEYNINSYFISNLGITYASLDLRLIEMAEHHQYNISLHEGQLVESNVFYRDTNLTEFHDLSSEDTGNGIKFENLDTGGSKLVMYENGSLDKFYLPYGNYTVSTEYLTEEFGLNMEYELSDTVWIRPEEKWYTFELNKENDFKLEISAIGESEIQLSTADIHRNVFTLKVENKGNTYSVVDLELQDVPAGWYVQLSNYTIPLDYFGTHIKEIVTVDITIPKEAYANNKITIRAIPRGDTSNFKSVTLTVKTPPIYGFDLKYKEDLDRGIGYNETQSFLMNIKKTGNAVDDLYIQFHNVPVTWNVSIPEAFTDKPVNDIKYQENIRAYILKMDQKTEKSNLTIQVKTPEKPEFAIDKEVKVLVKAWSGNKPDIEHTQQIDVSIRNPDIIIKNIKFENANLKEGTNVTIKATLQNKAKLVERVNVSLYISDVLIENKTVKDFDEDSTKNVEFFWKVAKYNLTDGRGRTFKFKVVVNGDKSVDETDFDNNQISVRKLIGEEPKPEEINIRPYLALLSLLIILIIIYAIYRWRKRI